MSKRKRRTKRDSDDVTNENENKNERSKGQLFNQSDVKSVEVSGYASAYEASPSNRIIQGRKIPTGAGK